MRFPIGIQDFREIRNGGYVYIDKTPLISRLVSHGKYYFLSRPRRFGKSLLTTTLQALYNNEAHLFEGLDIYDKWDWQAAPPPVIRLSFADIDFEVLGLQEAILQELHRIAKNYEIKLGEESLALTFKSLLQQLTEKIGQVVLIIDEYDKPIIHYIGGDYKKAYANQAVMKNFYSVIKDADQYIKFLFITGISRFAKVSVFSDLNNLRDISLSPPFAAICGITELELKHYFDSIIDKEEYPMIKKWYNGYTWDIKTKVYNPFSLFNYFSDRIYRNYWFSTGTTTFLYKLAKSTDIEDFDNSTASVSVLENLVVDNLDIKTLLFQTGYLTLKQVDFSVGIATLTYPNEEVRRSLLELMANSKLNSNDGLLLMNRIKGALYASDGDILKKEINTILASIPYQLWDKESEKYFHSLIHIIFTMVGFDAKSEFVTSKGRIDIVLEFDDKIYVLEIKTNATAEKGLQQISDKSYAEALLIKGKSIEAIGINVATDTKDVTDIRFANIRP